MGRIPAKIARIIRHRPAVAAPATVEAKGNVPGTPKDYFGSIFRRALDVPPSLLWWWRWLRMHRTLRIQGQKPASHGGAETPRDHLLWWWWHLGDNWPWAYRTVRSIATNETSVAPIAANYVIPEPHMALTGWRLGGTNPCLSMAPRALF